MSVVSITSQHICKRPEGTVFLAILQMRKSSLRSSGMFKVLEPGSPKSHMCTLGSAAFVIVFPFGYLLREEQETCKILCGSQLKENLFMGL